MRTCNEGVALLTAGGRHRQKETSRRIEVRGEIYSRKRVGANWKSDNIELRGVELHQ